MTDSEVTEVVRFLSLHAIGRRPAAQAQFLCWCGRLRPDGIALCQVGAVWAPTREGAEDMEVTTLGIDLARCVLQLHGVDRDGAIVLQRKVRRAFRSTFSVNAIPA